MRRGAFNNAHNAYSLSDMTVELCTVSRLALPSFSLGDLYALITTQQVPFCRRQGLAKQLMDYLESVTERDEGHFVDLFVRASNINAINMYRKVSFVIFPRRTPGLSHTTGAQA